ncbi:uncharacterized protein LOC118506910 [Anopheles stephensi]|uniref:uncharacterized protein LOC118506910 n=1 Tax=Anopheles stephensi TaxID=30069 RepID=UPI001658B67F|nr:uncharacterized protein LOC118506910 [Anopheles stephensi]
MASRAIVCLLFCAGVLGSVQCYEHLSRNGNELLFNPEFEYESDFRHDLEPDLLPPHDERSYFYHEEPDVFHHHTDYGLANLRPISPTPAFTLDPSYISPADIVPARAKRANQMKRKPSAKQRKREQKEFLPEEQDDDDEEARDDKDGSAESTDVDDYAERYEQFIAKHFEDLDSKRKKSAPQRKAPKKQDDEDDADEDEDGDYKFDRFDYSSSEDYERIKAESEEQSRRLAKDPGNCRTYEKDGMVCSVCHDPASDSASESCAYATEPHHRKYAYVKERNYDSKKDDPNQRAKAMRTENDEDDDDEDGGVETADREHTSAETRPERQTQDIGASFPNPTPVPKRVPTRPLRKPTLRSKPHQSATNGGGYRYQPTDLRSNRANMKLTVGPTDGENLPAPGQNEDIYVMDYADQDEVAKVLAEFKARDWSNCRKGKRMDDGELTCYQCTDAAGVNHEECMYVSESRQVASEPVRPPPSMVGEKMRKRKKVVPLTRKDLAAIEPVPASAANGVPPKEKQTVKRTVSFRSFVTGSGRSKEIPLAGAGSDGGERVIHYEHHISHEVP